MGKKQSLLSKIYFEAFKDTKLCHSIEKFYDCLFIMGEGYTPTTKSKHINGERPFVGKEKSYYIDEKYKNDTLEHLNALVIDVGNSNEKTTQTIIDIIKKELSETPETIERYQQLNKLCVLLIYLAKQQSEEAYVFFYYELFKYCIVDMVGDIKSYDVIEKAYKEFYEEIVKQYGISGTTAAMMILQRAQRHDTTNPIILYEAAEIEFTKGKALHKVDEKEAGKHYQNAYNYYYRAYENGLPLAGWNLGYLAQKDDMAQYVKQYKQIRAADRLEIAKKYFVEAEEAGCIRATNSLGNIYMSYLIDEEDNNPSNDNYINARKYYQAAAEKNEVHGMYNYGRILEKEIKQAIENDSAPIRVSLMRQKKNIEEMISYFEKAANEGYPPACYRYALYTCGLNLGVEDMIIPKNTKFPISQRKMWATDPVFAISRFELAKETATEDDLRIKATACLEQMQTNNLEQFFGK